MKGVALNMQGKHDEAVQAFDKAIEINPQKNALTWDLKGNALMDQEKYDEAIKAFDKALEIDPYYAEAWKSKGDALKALGRTSEADAAFVKAKAKELLQRWTAPGIECRLQGFRKRSYTNSKIDQ